ncbi:uncharacterized protein V6R79_007216 [Siganus canaliculatus]
MDCSPIIQHPQYFFFPPATFGPHPPSGLIKGHASQCMSLHAFTVFVPKRTTLRSSFSERLSQTAMETSYYKVDGYTDSFFSMMETDQPASETDKDQAGEDDGHWKAEGYSDDYLQLVADSTFIRTVKSAVYHLLNKVITDYRIAKCHGCSINHPSQRRHECLEVLHPYFYESNFYPLMKKLKTPNFIPAIQRLLITRDIKAEDARVRITAETLLRELKVVRNIFEAIHAAYEEVVDREKVNKLQTVTDAYTGTV